MRVVYNKKQPVISLYLHMCQFHCLFRNELGETIGFARSWVIHINTVSIKERTIAPAMGRSGPGQKVTGAATGQKGARGERMDRMPRICRVCTFGSAP